MLDDKDQFTAGTSEIERFRCFVEVAKTVCELTHKPFYKSFSTIGNLLKKEGPIPTNLDRELRALLDLV